MASLCTVVYAGSEGSMKRGHGPMGPGFPPRPAGHLLSKAIDDNMASDGVTQARASDSAQQISDRECRILLDSGMLLSNNRRVGYAFYKGKYF